MTEYSLRADRTFLQSGAFQVAFLGAAVLALTSANPLLTLAAVTSLPVLAALVWRPGEPPVLAFALGMQWLQVCAKVFHADLLGVPVADLHKYSGDIELAFWLSLLGLVTLAGGMRLGMRLRRLRRPSEARAEAVEFSSRRLWLAYLGAFGAYLVLGGAAWTIPGITQLLLAVINLKWVFLFALVYVAALRGTGTVYIGTAIAIEVVVGMTGFFGGYKEVFFLITIAFLTARPVLSARHTVPILVLGVSLFTLSVFWSAVKTDYRSFVSGGTRSQVILVGREARVDHLLSALEDFEADDARRGIQDLATRIAYLDYFAVVLNHVPASVPHENGALLGKAALHIVTPRLLFPDKPPTPHDTDITSQYTGLSFEAAGPGTSISMGYMAESYVDFGAFGMFLPIFGLGYLLGWMYAVLIGYSGTPLLLNYGLATMVLMSVASYETAMIKLVGAVVTLFLVVLVLQRYLFPRISPWLRVPVRRAAGGGRVVLARGPLGRRLGS